MSEEEKLIDYLNSIDITRIFYDNPPHDNHVGIGKAIQGLLDLYKKEKEKNKTLKQVCEKYYVISSNPDNYISKDKIRDRISILEQIKKDEEKAKFILSYSIYNAVTNEIDDLEELLKGE